MLLLIHILLFLPWIYGLLKIGPLVYTKQGLIRGLQSDNGQYSMFLGIPYADVDIANPFGPSTPHAVFNGTFEAFDDSAVCPQIPFGTLVAVGTIDCLRLNVYVPNTATPKDRFPVMVWLHSGGFFRGNGNRGPHSPDFLIRHNVIIVSLNFRLGPYGFFCLNTPTVSGNQGLKDQVLALKWVQENIQSFGGDANQVTVFGGSSGSKSIHIHLLANNEKLFDRAIMQSGTLIPWRFAKPDNAQPLRVAERLGYETDKVEDALTFLASQNVHSVSEASHFLGISNFTGDRLPEARPCIENKFEGALITDSPLNIRSSKVRNMPIIIGYSSQEMLYKYGNVGAEVLDTYSFKDRLEPCLDVIDDKMVEEVKKFYIGDANVGVSVKEQILNFESDFNHNHPTERTIKRFLNDGAKAVYYYVFHYEGKRNYLKKAFKVNRTGACHGDELGYLFRSDFLSSVELTPEDQHMIDIITTMWTNFAKYGDPTPEVSELLPIKWLPVNNSTENYLKIDSKLSLLPRPFQERMAFWDRFYALHGEAQATTQHIYDDL